MQELVILQVENDLRIDSRDMAELFDIKHSHFLRSINKHLNKIEEHFERVCFQNVPIKTNGGVQNFSVAYLTESQALYVGTFSRNTEIVIDFKAKLVKAFLEARKKLSTYALPKTYLDSLKELVCVIEEGDKIKQTLLIRENEIKGLSEMVSVSLKMIADDADKVDMFNKIVSCDDSKSFKEVGAMLGYGEKTFFQKMRDMSYLQKEENIPYRPYMEKGWFVVKVGTYIKDGVTKLHPQPRFTALGISEISKVLNADTVNKTPIRTKKYPDVMSGNIPQV